MGKTRKKRVAAPPSLLSVTEVAALLKVSRVAVLYAIQDGRLKAQKVGTVWVIRREDLSAYHPRAYRRREVTE